MIQKIDQLLLQEKTNDNWVSQTVRLRDVDGKWTQKYNSVYQGVMILEDGRKNQEVHIGY